MRNKLIRIIIALLILSFILFSLYVFVYQQVVNAGSEIEDKHCLNVNPQIIKRKQAYMDSLRVLQASGSAEKYLEEMDEYLEATKEFVKAEEEWLNEQSEFLRRIDYTLLTPDDIQLLNSLQFLQRQEEKNSSKKIVEIFENDNTEVREILMVDIVEHI